MYYLIVFAVMPLISPTMFLSITIPAHMSKSTPTWIVYKYALGKLRYM